MSVKFWHDTIPGIIAVIGCATMFVYALLRALAGYWWMMLAVLIITILAGLFNIALATPKQAKKKDARKVRRPAGPPGTH